MTPHNVSQSAPKSVLAAAPPNNVLVLGPPHSGKIRTCQFLTNDLDTSTIPSNSHSGLVYNFNLHTKYYGSNVNLLIEEYPDSRSSSPAKLSHSLASFYKDFSSAEFSELREALDGMIFTVGPHSASHAELDECISLMCQTKALFEDSDIFCIVVGVDIQGAEAEAVEDAFISSGFEFVNFHDSGHDEYRGCLGRDRLYEVLASHDWSHRAATTVPDATYKKHKMDSVQQMSTSLMEADAPASAVQHDGSPNGHATPTAACERAMDVSELFEYLKVAKEKSQAMSLEAKKAYVEELVEDFMNYI